ncbi:hypothetical protein AQ490_16770 [Wenjunlia vitaminophila]|uniref:Flippase-like domain-containing protein n=1 Tax=Wenjunlia vitaminophila TaxID=76728 RepID=A0A0T6LXF9_WENVI|nr:YbhN family protein [Wenjunlia vitaminophila]KRV50656.1 hypothetical protein AQ490_16545 [Wenjunlia vitaminophila]KRV50695.1 hypothetical protein AQ490_16770 [Wenjunlia vitaminophila]
MRARGRAGSWRWLWWLVAAALATAALLVATSRRGELKHAADLLVHVNPGKVSVAVLAEAAAFVCLAAVPRWLLAAGGLGVPLADMVRLMMAANAMAGVFPGGAAFSAAWLYRQLRRRGAGQALTAAALASAGGLSALGLLVVIVLGALTAGSRGPGAAMLRVAAGLVLAVLVALLVLRSASVRAALGRAWARVRARYGRVQEADAELRSVLKQARSVQPGVRPWLRPGALALLNWVFDAGCLVASVWALGIPVPWQGVLLAYGLVQIPGSIRLTPGGIGIVEAGLTGLLVVYGLTPGQAFAATLLYRIWNYWLPQPIGWGCWLGVMLRERR